MKSTSYRLVAFLLLAALLVTSGSALAQSGQIKGRVIDADSKQPMGGATVMLVGTTFGTIADQNGNYIITNIPSGSYSIRALFVGYLQQVRSVVVGPGEREENFNLVQTVLQQKEVIVEVNRAHERETPVAFTTIEKEQIAQRIHGQDAPLLLKGTPGFYAYSTDGVGNGEAKLFVRGFNQNYVQVLINGIPTNDPESNAVYWSNWGSVSSSAASIQVQRGAGSSLYGAGAFGGSFNIITGSPRPKRYYAASVSFGSPMNTMYGVDLNTGLLSNSMAFSLKVERKISEGTRLGARYEGWNYYFSGSWFINNEQSLKLVLHGAPQKHGYSYSNDISFFKYFDYKANTAPWLPRSVVDALPASPNSGLPSYGLTDGTRELVTDKIVDISHNHFHKPQLELHYNYDISPVSAIRATAFYSKGRGGGTSINSSGTVPNNLRAPDGSIMDPIVADTLYLKNAYQRDSYSMHQQGGLLANYEMQPNEMVKLIFGGEFRLWTADHPGHFTNLFGKTSLSAQSYGVIDTGGVITNTTFRRRTFEGDVSQTNDMAITGWELSSTDPTYKTQYRNYRGETPQYTLFANAIVSYEGLTLTGTLQFVGYSYKLTENMPSENAMGRRLMKSEIADLGLGTTRDEGPDGLGRFFMKEYTSTSSSTVKNWYVFDLVNATRTRQFWQPKFGFNYNFNENINLFGSVAHVERFVDLSVYYNQGRVNDQAGDEKSNQFEAGIGWTSQTFTAKLNAYTMAWDNKSSRVQDVSMAGQPGYDRNGYRTILVGSSTNRGIEFEFNSDLSLLIEGLSVRGSATISQNKWKSVLDEVKTDPSTGKRQIFNSSGYTDIGTPDTVFIDELAGTHVGGPPQTMASLGVSYRFSDFFVGVDANYYADQWGLDGEPFLRVDGEWTDRTNLRSGFTYVYNQKVPNRIIFDGQAGYNINLGGLRGTATVQVLNILDKKYIADVDNFGVLPGYLRSFRFNLVIGI